MNGSFHVDSNQDDSVTAILNLSPEDEGGDFVYLENDIEKRIKYKCNNLILLNSTMPHYGEAFKKDPRLTLVFHTYVRH